MLTRRQVGGLLFGVCSGFAGQAGAEPTRATRLFDVARSKNRNVVRYVASSSTAGLEPKLPIAAYWQMLAEDGRREELSFAERKLAYGFTVSELREASCQVQLVAFPQRPLTIERGPQGFRALVTIAGERAVLQRIYVKTSEGLLFPGVEYLDVSGTSLRGARLRERIRAR